MTARYMPGMVVGDLLILERFPYDRERTESRLLCRCACGKEWPVPSRRLSRIVSCGCRFREEMRVKQTTHAHSYGPEYAIWANMVYRCTNPRAPNFRLYGARGITVCERWRRSFSDFLADVGYRPSPEHSLDRIDNDRSYEPGNVRWATATEQNRNRRNTPVLTHDGETLSLMAWAERVNLPAHAIRRRLKAGWSVHDALATPLGKSRDGRAPVVEFRFGGAR